MESNKKEELENEMRNLFVADSPVIIEWAEMVRESLNDFSASHESLVETNSQVSVSQVPIQVNDLCRLTIHSREPIIDRKSTFQAFYVDIEQAADAGRFRDQLLENNKIKNATHNMFVSSS